MKSALRSVRRPTSSTIHARPAALAGAIAAICAASLHAAEPSSGEDLARFADTAHPYATIGYGYDSNIFRVDDKLNIDDMADNYLTANAGFDADIHSGLQRYELRGEVNHTAYDTHDDLDYTGGRAAAIWDWSTGTDWTGTLGYRFSRTMRDFANQTNVFKVKDLRTENTLVASVDYDIPGNWKTGLGADYADVSFSDSKALDLKRSTVKLYGAFVTSAGSELSLDGRWAHGEYDNTPTANFDEYTLGPSFRWKASERTQMFATVGYTKRDFDSELRRDYDGVVGRVDLTLADDGSTQFTASAYRELSNLGDEIADFAIVDGISLEPTWHLRPTLDLRANASYEKRDFQSDLAGGDRQDDVVTAGVFADWQFARHFKLSVGADMQQRSSDRALLDFDFHRFTVQVVGTL